MKHQLMEYEIVSSIDKDDVVKVVNRMLREGWTLYGSLCVQGPPFNQYSQALTRSIEYRE